ncbi:hypothetical protein [Clostridium sp. JN-1]|uniref:hypothetical protein n=1 Tax=Clostridium sp. JN-1 TaxID=2483110 RepID=UPI001FA94C40|nr:hypothetical protein [Clostridium sp. JN-1]
MASQIGLKNIHIAVLKSGDNMGVKYDSPINLERAISSKLKGKFYSRDFDGNYMMKKEGMQVL